LAPAPVQLPKRFEGVGRAIERLWSLFRGTLQGDRRNHAGHMSRERFGMLRETHDIEPPTAVIWRPRAGRDPPLRGFPSPRPQSVPDGSSAAVGLLARPYRRAIPAPCPPPPFWGRSGLAAPDLIHRAVGERDDKQRAGGPVLDVRDDAEILAEQQTFALRQVVFIEVIRDPIV
jgi:hypothetical protein